MFSVSINIRSASLFACFSIPHVSKIIQYLSFSVWHILLSIMLSKSIHIIADGRIFFSFMPEYYYMGFPDGSVDKESTCNVGDPCLIPGLGRSPAEGIGYALQNCWASLVAQLLENPPAMWETRVRTLGWEDPLEKGKATHSSILENSRGHKESDTILFHSINMRVYMGLCVYICP